MKLYILIRKVLYMARTKTTPAINKQPTAPRNKRPKGFITLRKDGMTCRGGCGYRREIESWLALLVKGIKRYGVLLPVAEALHLSVSTIKKHRDEKTPVTWEGEETTFDKVIDYAYQYYVEWCEKEVSRRAFRGVIRDIYYQGVKVGEEKVYSDTLAMFRLKALAPEKYRERYDQTVHGINNEPMKFVYEVEGKESNSDDNNKA